MRLFLVGLLCAISMSASAQWYRVDLLVKKHQRFAALPSPRSHGPKIQFTPVKFNQPIVATTVTPGDYELELAEASVMRSAQHNMRFHEYHEASYNFSELARLYVQQDRLSEAKWYYLQSLNISRQQNDDKHTISSLMALAMIKAMIGDTESGLADLLEARQLALARGMKEDAALVEKEHKFIAGNKDSLIKTNLRYAEAVEKEKAKKAGNKLH